MEGQSRVNPHPFYDVDDKEYTICKTHSCGNFVNKINVPRRIDEMYKMRFSRSILEDKRHRRRFDGNFTLSRENMRVGVTNLWQTLSTLGALGCGKLMHRLVCVPYQLVCLEH